MYHQLLERQLKKYVHDQSAVIPALAELFQTISQTYAHNDEDRRLIERSLEISSAELGGINARLAEEKKQLEQETHELEIAKAKDEALLTNMGEGMVALDREGNVVKLNQLTKDLFSISDTAIGQKLHTIVTYYGQLGKPVPPEQRPETVVLTGGGKVSEVFEVHPTPTSKRLIQIVATPINQSAELVGAILIIRDVTREKEIDRMKTEFISLASHQLRTPLSAIRWFAEMLINGDAGELQVEQHEFAQNIYKSTERMIDLVNALLNISRIESGRIIVDPQPTDLRELIDGVVRDLQVKIEERRHQLTVSVHSALSKINLDPRLIRQVYMNLLSNAIKYTPKGGEIFVMVSRKDDMIISQIADNGYGIPKIAQNRVFEKFFRAENVAKVETDGTGLGLYLIKAIIESSQGKIWFASEEGKGTTFWFSLPASGMKAKAGEVTINS